jgi:hypothetical protein
MLDRDDRPIYLERPGGSGGGAGGDAVRSEENPQKFKVPETMRMWETCAVDLRVQLPRAVAAEVEEVQRRDPEMLSRILLYGLTRRAIFEHLARADGEGAGR